MGPSPLPPCAQPEYMGPLGQGQGVGGGGCSANRVGQTLYGRWVHRLCGVCTTFVRSMSACAPAHRRAQRNSHLGGMFGYSAAQPLDLVMPCPPPPHTTPHARLPPSTTAPPPLTPVFEVTPHPHPDTQKPALISSWPGGAAHALLTCTLPTKSVPTNSPLAQAERLNTKTHTPNHSAKSPLLSLKRQNASKCCGHSRSWCYCPLS